MSEKKWFTITTNREVADQITKECELEIKRGNHRSYTLGEVRHEANYSVIQIVAKEDKIKPEDLFWLGHHSAQN